MNKRLIWMFLITAAGFGVGLTFLLFENEEPTLQQEVMNARPSRSEVSSPVEDKRVGEESLVSSASSTSTMFTKPLAVQKKWALERRRYMHKLIQEDPERAIQEALSLQNRAGLLPEVADEIEQIVSGQGFFGVMAQCNHSEGEHAHTENCRLYYEVRIEGRVYHAHVYGKRLQQRTRENETLFGVAVGNDLALHEDAENASVVQEDDP